jgi:hypothetical protein
MCCLYSFGCLSGLSYDCLGTVDYEELFKEILHCSLIGENEYVSLLWHSPLQSAAVFKGHRIR